MVLCKFLNVGGSTVMAMNSTEKPQAHALPTRTSSGCASHSSYGFFIFLLTGFGQAKIGNIKRG